MNDFIERFIEFNAAYESPTEFFYWSAVAGIAAVLRDSCYLPLGDTKLYPNVYVLIIAKPAMRKAKPLNSILELAKVVSNTKIIEGRTSIQAVIQRLSEIERLKDGRAIQGASGIIYSEEISAMFTEDDANIPVLTDLYDFKSTYTSSLISRGTTRLTNVVVSLLGASNEELLRPIFTNRAIYGGLLSRCLLVYGDKVRHRNSLMFEDPKKYDPAPLQQLIKKIATLRGAFNITQRGRKRYDEWYNDVCPQLEKSAGKTGAEGRIHTNALKLAMILNVSAYQTLEIDVPIIDKAIDRVQSLFKNYKRLTLGSGKNKEIEPTVYVLELLWNAKDYTLSHRELMAIAWENVSAETMASVTKTLVEAGLITIDDSNHKTKYKLTESSIKYFQSQLSK